MKKHVLHLALLTIFSITASGQFVNIQQKIRSHHSGGGNSTLNTGVTPTADLGPYFIENISIKPHFMYKDADAPSGTLDALAYVCDANANVLGNPYYVNYTSANGGRWYCYDIDASDIPVGGFVYFAFFDANVTLPNFNFLDVSKAYFPNIIPTPKWLKKRGAFVGISAVNRGSGELTFLGKFSATDLLFEKNVANEGLLAKSKVNLDALEIEFGGTFDTKNNVTAATPTKLTAGVKFKDNGKENKYGMFDNLNGALYFDDDFNPTISVSATFGPKYGAFKGYEIWNKEVFYTLAGVNGPGLTVGGLCLGAKAEFAVTPSIKGQIVYGKSGNKWGFNSVGTDQSSLLFVAEATAAIKGSLYLACASFMGKGSGYGTLARVECKAKLALGAGIEGTTIPTNTLGFVKGAKATLEGNIDVLGSRVYSNTFYDKSWGDPISFKIGNPTGGTNANDISYTAKTSQKTVNATPASWPSGVISAQDSVLTAVWLDDINFGTKKALLATHYDPQLNAFSTPTIIAKNDSAMLLPSCKLLPNKDVLVAWSQLSMPESAINQNTMSTDDIVRNQEIWFSIVNPVTQTVVYKGKLSDITGSRADGEPKIHWGMGNQGMITWQGNDALAGYGSDVYYSVLNYDPATYTYTFSQPNILNDLPGNNYKVEVAYTNGNNAIAEWMTDDDQYIDTLDYTAKVMMATWDGTAWSNSFVRFGNDPTFIIKDFSLAVEGTNGLEAVTYSYANNDTLAINDTLHFNGIFLGTWTDGDPFGSSYSYRYDTSTMYNYAQPRAAVNVNGLASIIMKQNSISDTLDYGKTNLWLKDIYNNSSNWENLASTNPTNLDMLSDPNLYAWDVSSKFGYLTGSGGNTAGEIMYLFSQEMDSQGNTNPTYGEVFGQPNLNLVLRAFKIEKNGASFVLTDVPEPATANVVTFYQKIAPFKIGFELKQNYPNPFTGTTTIPFHVSKAGKVTIEILDIAGRIIATVVDDYMQGGDYKTEFESKNLQSGIYFYKLSTNGTSDIRKMVVNN
jgi:hypothetical protein